MVRVTTTEFIEDYGRLADQALIEPFDDHEEWPSWENPPPEAKDRRSPRSRS